MVTTANPQQEQLDIDRQGAIGQRAQPHNPFTCD